MSKECHIQSVIDVYAYLNTRIVIVNEWEKRATDFILGIILHLQTVIQINIIYFCLGKRETGDWQRSTLPIVMGFG